MSGANERSRRRWAMSMTWHDLLLLHWPVAESALRRIVPDPLEIDTFEDDAWIGVVPFRMSGVRPRGLPAVVTRALPLLKTPTT